MQNFSTEEKAGEHLRILKGPYLQRMSPRSVVIMWETNIPVGGYIAYGETSHPDKKLAVGQGKIHEITIDNLKPETTYRYEVVSKLDDEIVSDSGIFTTAPEKERPFQFAVYGDTRTNTKRHQSVIDAMLKCPEGKPEFVIHSGDLVGSGSKYEQWGKEFFSPAYRLMKNIPLWPCIGNHEENAQHYYDFFSLPNNERWYSFDYSNARFLQLDSNIGYDTEHANFMPGSEQFQWLEKELKSCRKRWKFVTLHHPAFTSGPHGVLGEDGKPKEMPIALQQKFLVPLFEKYEVDIVFSGHDHVYERSKKGDIYYIVSGGGGAPNYAKSQENPYSQVFESTLHYCLIKIDARKLRMTVWDTQGNQIDYIKMSK